MRELSQFYFFIYSDGPERDMLGSINWCFGGVATAAAVVRRILDVGGVVRYVSLMILYLERAIFVDLCSLIQLIIVIFRAHESYRVILIIPCDGMLRIIVVGRRYRRIDAMMVVIVVPGCWIVIFYYGKAVTPITIYSFSWYKF
jgi:hypothetical protein